MNMDMPVKTKFDASVVITNALVVTTVPCNIISIISIISSSIM